MGKSFDKVLMGAAGGTEEPDANFKDVEFLAHFEGANNGVNNAFDDSSASNHTITAIGNVTQGSFSPYSPAYGVQAVNGVQQSRKFALTTIANAYGAWTVEWWFKADVASVDWQQMVTEWDNGTVAQQCWEVFVSGGFIRTYVRDSGSNSYSSDLSGVSAAAVTSSKWHYLSVADDGSNFRVHLDGALIQKDSRVPQSGSTNRFMIGFEQAATTFAGTLADVKVSDVSRYTDSTYAVPTVVGGLVDSDTLLLVGGNNARDLTGNYATGATVLYPVVPTSQIGRVEAYDPAVDGASGFFDGSGDALSTPTSSDLAFGTGNFTLEFWVYQLEVKNYTIYWDYRSQNTQNTLYMYQYGSGVIDLYIAGTSHTFTPPGMAGKWSHIAISRSSSTTKLFVDGAQYLSFSDSTDYNAGGDTFYISRYFYNDAYHVNGYISDFRIVKGTAVYTSAFTPPTAPLPAITNTKLLLNMADAQAFDSTGKNNLILVANANTSTDQAKSGDTSLHVDGTGDLIYTGEGDAFAFGNGDFTIEFWYYGDATQDDYLFDMRLSGDNEARVAVYFNANAKLSYFVTNATRITTTTALSANTWTHIALVRSSAVTRFYFNGNQDNQSFSDSIVMLAAPIRIGRKYADAQYVTGYFDDFRISKVARYTGNFSAPTKQLPDTGP